MGDAEMLAELRLSVSRGIGHSVAATITAPVLLWLADANPSWMPHFWGWLIAGLAAVSWGCTGLLAYYYRRLSVRSAEAADA